MPPERRPPGGSPSGVELSRALRQGVAELDLALDNTTLQRLLDYLALLVKWNAVYNLTAVREPSQMLVQHLLDSLAVIPPLARRLALDHASIADVGSGAGLPGIPLAIVHPRARVLSIEPIGKKTAFQRQASTELALTNVNVYTGRAESLATPCDLVICRAFASLVDFVDAAAGLTGPSTLLAAMKGQRHGTDAEIAALGGEFTVEVEPLRVPFLSAERHLVLLRPAPGRPR
jgi:16S rRNA (guanine527-N7)-methyltransferase